MPGQCGRHRLTPMMVAIVASDSAIVAPSYVDSVLESTGNLSSSSPGSGSASLSPMRSLSWLATMITAMPAVKPTVTGYGMNLMYVPSFRKPIAARINPDSIVARINPSMPCACTVAATSTMNAPAGPPI